MVVVRSHCKFHRFLGIFYFVCGCDILYIVRPMKWYFRFIHKLFRLFHAEIKQTFKEAKKRDSTFDRYINTKNNTVNIKMNGRHELWVNGKRVDPDSVEGKRAMGTMDRSMKDLDKSMAELDAEMKQMEHDLDNMFK